MKNAFLKKFIFPRMINEDGARREFILNILLAASILLIFLSVLLSIIAATLHFFTAAANQNNTMSLWIEIILLIFFISLYALSRMGFFRFSSYLLLSAFFLLAIYMGYVWGVDVNAGILLYVLVIVMAGILINTRFAFLMTFIIALTILSVSYLQQNNIIQANRYWRNESWTQTDTIMVAIIFFVIATVSWLSNREIEKSLARARRSEGELKLERDSLEIRVEERTAELKKAQMEQVSQLYRFAEFGKLSSGLFHDLMNLLTAASLNIQQIKDEHTQGIEETKSHFDKAAIAIKRMENFIIAIRRQMAKQKTETRFSLADGINSVMQILEYKAKRAKVKIIFLPGEDITLHGDPTKFSQMILNLIANAIDSYLDVNVSREKIIEIEALPKDGAVYLSVEDWGCGIAPEVMDKIFQPFFTTKGADMGTGIGLSLTKNVVERDFGGAIKCESEANNGSKFTVILPIKGK